MSKQVTLEGAPRAEHGKGHARRLRRTGRVPAVVYGRGVEPTRLSVDARELYHALHTPAGLNVLIRLRHDGDEHLTMAREVQRHPVRGDVVHVDFYAVDRDRPIEVDVPIHLTGQEDVEKLGGVVSLVMYTVGLRVKPLDVPDYLELDISELEIGDSRRAGEIVLPEGAELTVDAEETIVIVSAPTVEELPEPEVAAELAEGVEPPEGAEAGEGAPPAETPAEEGS